MQTAPQTHKTWREAKDAGAKYFAPGRVCSNGNVALWLTSRCACWCEACKAKWSKKVSASANRERAREYAKAWASANPERRRANKQKTLEKIRTGVLKRSEGCPGKRRARLAMRREAVRRATPPWADHLAIAAVYQNAQEMRAAGLDVHVDHIIPLKGESVCGLHIAENLQIIPAAENLRKHNRIVRIGRDADDQLRACQAVILADRGKP